MAKTAPIEFMSSQISTMSDGQQGMSIQLSYQGLNQTISGIDNGPIDAAVNAMGQFICSPLEVVGYHEHSIGSGSGVSAVCYMEIKVAGHTTGFGVATDSNIMTAAIKALISGVNRKWDGKHLSLTPA